MEFDIKNSGTLFYFDEDDESRGSVCVRVLSSPESNRIEKITVTKKNKFHRQTHTQYVETNTDEKMYSKLMWDYVIVSWDNVKVDGKDLECNTENKVKLMEDPTFSYFVLKCIETLQDDMESGKTLAKN